MNIVTITLNDFQWQQNEYDLTVTYSPYRGSGHYDVPPDYPELISIQIDGLTPTEVDDLMAIDAFCDTVLDSAIEANDQFDEYSYNDYDYEYDDLFYDERDEFINEKIAFDEENHGTFILDLFESDE